MYSLSCTVTLGVKNVVELLTTRIATSRKYPWRQEVAPSVSCIHPLHDGGVKFDKVLESFNICCICLVFYVFSFTLFSKVRRAIGGSYFGVLLLCHFGYFMCVV